jgi:hypothetical protein
MQLGVFALSLINLHDFGVRGTMMVFGDFVIGMKQFGTRVLPLMRCRDMAKPAAD